MRHYKFPKWLRRLYPGAIWDFSFSEKLVFLTFDDGPNPETTQALLELLSKQNIKATFFCLGENVQAHPELFQQILDQGHIAGNHSMSHPKGIHTSKSDYIKDIEAAGKLIPGKLFRPPYGKIKPSQHRALTEMGYQTIFWSIMSYDFDQKLQEKEFISKMVKLTNPGAILVFHDNLKAKSVIQNELPLLIQALKEEGYHFKALEPELFS